MRCVRRLVIGMLFALFGAPPAVVDAHPRVRATQEESEALAVDQNDPIARLKRGVRLQAEGRHAEALQEYLWCYDHGDAAMPGYAGVRRSFLLGFIARLGERHLPALQALRDRRDTVAARLKSGSESSDDVADVCAIDRSLWELDRAIDLYESLRTERALPRAQRWAFANDIVEPLAADRRYTDILQMLEEPETYVDERLRHFRSRVDALKASKDRREANGVERFSASCVSRLAPVFEALAGMQRRKDADRIAVLLAEFARTEGTYVALVDRAARAGDVELARKLVDRGLASLPEDEHAAVRAARERISGGK